MDCASALARQDAERNQLLDNMSCTCRCGSESQQAGLDTGWSALDLMLTGFDKQLPAS
jgi:hypothetical protein